MENKMMLLQSFAPEDVFSGIVNRHHDFVKRQNTMKARAQQRRKADRRLFAQAIAVSVVIFAIGFMLGAGGLMG